MHGWHDLSMGTELLVIWNSQKSVPCYLSQVKTIADFWENFTAWWQRRLYSRRRGTGFVTGELVGDKRVAVWGYNCMCLRMYVYTHVHRWLLTHTHRDFLFLTPTPDCSPLRWSRSWGTWYVADTQCTRSAAAWPCSGREYWSRTSRGPNFFQRSKHCQKGRHTQCQLK